MDEKKKENIAFEQIEKALSRVTIEIDEVKSDSHIKETKSGSKDEEIKWDDIFVSPLKEVVVTWKQTNKHLGLWEIIDGKKELKKIDDIYLDKSYKIYPEETYRDKFYSYSRLVISDRKHLVLHLNRKKPYNIGIFNLNMIENNLDTMENNLDTMENNLDTMENNLDTIENNLDTIEKILNTEKETKLNAPNFEGEMDSWGFIENSDFAVIKGDPIYRAYIFSHSKKDKDKWNCIKMIELKHFTWSHISFDKKLFLAIEKTLILSQWNLKNLILEQQYMIESSKRCRITQNGNSTLLVVQEVNTLFIYSMALGMKLAQLNESNSKIYFIGTDIGERMMISGTWGSCNIIDPFESHPQDNLKDAKKLLRGVEINMPYVVQSDKIIGWFKKDLCIRSLIPDNWIKYLREELRDFKGFGSSYEASRVEKMVDEIIKNTTGTINPPFKDKIEPYDDGIGFQYSCKGYLLEWIVRIDADYDCAYIELAAHKSEIKTEKWKRVEPKRIFSRHREKHYGKEFIINCNPLENENLAMITRAGIYIWTVNSKNETNRIQLLYFWDNELKRENFETPWIINMLKEFSRSCKQSGSYLPTMNFDLVLKDSHLDPMCRQEWIDCYKHDKMFLAYYGTSWIKKLVESKVDIIISELFGECIYLSIENGCIKNTKFLDIIITSFPELSQNYTAYVSEFLAHIAFALPFHNRDLGIVDYYSTSSHLAHCGTYIQISKTTTIDLIVSRLNFRKRIHDFFDKMNLSFFKSETNLTIQLMVPLPKFVTYPYPYNSLKDFIYPAP
ncbi:18440_t:CDS:2, partial [Acaulospora morrowiae]